MKIHTQKVGKKIGSGDSDDELHVWYDRSQGGWFNAFSGFFRGLFSESEDAGPFESKSDAQEDVEVRYEEWHTN